MALGLIFSSALLVSTHGAVGDGTVPPPDGWYANVTIEGRAVAMIHVKDSGATVLVDTDGRRHPRIWAEQYRRQGNLPNGMYDIHKTNVNGNDVFSDDPIDRRGMWSIDGAGNITAH